MTIKQRLTVVILLLAWVVITAEDCSGSADPPRATSSPICLVIQTTADPSKYKNVRVDPEQVKKDCG